MFLQTSFAFLSQDFYCAESSSAKDVVKAEAWPQKKSAHSPKEDGKPAPSMIQLADKAVEAKSKGSDPIPNDTADKHPANKETTKPPRGQPKPSDTSMAVKLEAKESAAKPLGRSKEGSKPRSRDAETKDRSTAAAKEPSKSKSKKPESAQALEKAKTGKKESSKDELVLVRQGNSKPAEDRRASTKTDRRDEKDRSKSSRKPGTTSDKAAVKSEGGRSPGEKGKAAASGKPKEKSVARLEESKDANIASGRSERDLGGRSNHNLSSKPELASQGKEAATNASRARGSGKPEKNASKVAKKEARHTEKASSKEHRSKSKEQGERPRLAKSAAADKSRKDVLPQLPPLTQEPTSARQGKLDGNPAPPLLPVDRSLRESSNHMLDSDLYLEPGPDGRGNDSPSFGEQFCERHALDIVLAE